MSSSSFCQGLQSCLEPRLKEPRVLRLKLTPSKSNFSGSISPSSEPQSHIESNNKNDDSDMKSEKTEDIITSGWSFLQCLTTTTTKERDGGHDGGNEKVYIHPLAKRSSSMLSKKSLEMCTESLGSETGGSLVSSESSDDDGDDDSTVAASIPSPEITTGIINNYTSTRRLRETNNSMTKRTNRSSVSFPPPLTSIGDSSGGVRVRPHREGGRLVLQAVTVSSSPAYFRAERRDGRLRLCLVEHLLHPSPDEEEDEEEEEIDEEEEEEEEDEDCCDDCEGVEGKSGKVRDEIGMEKLGRSSSRCNEGGRGGGAGNKLWEPFWVAT